MTLLPSPTGLKSPFARRSAWIIVAAHATLLLLMTRDYFADNDLGYHISLARQYAEHGTYFWDRLNWAPTGRPNLQGPLLHFAVGVLGRILGGAGDDYVFAFSVLAVLQWAAAMFTAIWFARRYGGDRAALIAAALLSGSVYAAGAFFAGVPSGWIFILTPWAIHCFLKQRYTASALCTAAAMYVHLGGASTAPFGVFLAAVFTRRWKELLRVGLITAVLTSPYLVHFLLHLDWYTGRRGHVAGSIATLIYLLAAPGLVWLLRRPRENLFLLVWAVAPLAWLYQDSLRFFLQSTIAASAIAGIFVTDVLGRLGRPRLQAAVTAALVLVATVFPLSIPSLPVEFAWAAGRGFPRELDWNEARTLARVLEQAGLADRIVNSYYDSLSAAMAVYRPLRQEFGHWGEVRPAVNPARDLSAAEKVYVLPLPPNDEVLRRLEQTGWMAVHGGSDQTTIATLTAAAPLEEAAAITAGILSEEAEWLARNAVNNRMPPPADLFDFNRIVQRRRRMALQRARAGRIQAALLVYAFAMERADRDRAPGVRDAARAWGTIANFIGDETAIDYVGDARFERFRHNVSEWGRTVSALRDQPLGTPEIDRLTGRLFDDLFG
jgi:hypothetical protein